MFVTDRHFCPSLIFVSEIPSYRVRVISVPHSISRLHAPPTNIRLGHNSFTDTNVLAYYGEKSFMQQSLEDPFIMVTLKLSYEWRIYPASSFVNAGRF